MKYSGSLVKEEREKIFSLFLRKDKLKFADIEKALKIRSNMVSYHLSQMSAEKIIKKSGEYYFLTEEGEKYLPIFSHITGKEIGPVPVILVAVLKKKKTGQRKEFLLIRRETRPYKGYWSLVGGKMRLNESFDDASVRLVRQKTGIEGTFKSINAVLHEKVHGSEIKHSFILFFTQVIAEKKNVKNNADHNRDAKETAWFREKNIAEAEVIPSDLWLIKRKLNSKIAVYDANMHDEEGKMKGFNVRKLNNSAK